MYLIDSAGNVAGAFTNGAPPATPATVVDAAWMNEIQTELVNVAEATGNALVKGTRNQVLTAIQQLIARSMTGYKRDYAPTIAYTSLANFLAGTYVSLGIVLSSAGELAEAHVSSPGGGGQVDSILYSMVVNVTAACTAEIVVPLLDDSVLFYLDGTLENTWTTSSSQTAAFAQALTVGTHVIQFLNRNTSGNTPASTFVNDWMTGLPVTWLRAAHS